MNGYSCGHGPSCSPPTGPPTSPPTNPIAGSDDEDQQQFGEPE
jgi:hypothetical protein